MGLRPWLHAAAATRLFTLAWFRRPWAYAHGYLLPPLRGWLPFETATVLYVTMRTSPAVHGSRPHVEEIMAP